MVLLPKINDCTKNGNVGVMPVNRDGEDWIEKPLQPMDLFWCSNDSQNFTQDVLFPHHPGHNDQAIADRDSVTTALSQHLRISILYPDVEQVDIIVRCSEA